MNINFKKITLHNFGSYGHTEIDLTNRGFCLVSGENQYKLDTASSNGAGKSFLWSAICYALTGETIQGLTNNLKNINISENECWTELEVKIDADLYTIHRINKPKSDLKLTKNGKDISGKGVRESDAVLAKLLPDLNKDLVASTIILGQGLPNKFSSFSPVGRKDLLERLTKSDFMIEDIKTRLTARQNEVATQLRSLEDSLLINENQLNQQTGRLNAAIKERDMTVKPDFDKLISTLIEKIDELEKTKLKAKNELIDLENKYQLAENEYVQLLTEKNTAQQAIINEFNSQYTTHMTDKATCEANIRTLTKQIADLKAITDICPTCGQRLIGVIKPDTGAQELALENENSKLKIVLYNVDNCLGFKAKRLEELDNSYKNRIETILKDKTNLNTAKQATQAEYDKANAEQQKCITEKQRLEYEQQTFETSYANLLNTINILQKDIAGLQSTISYTATAKLDIDQHKEVLKKIESLIKRDFRGYLLVNIIDYLNKKAKEYCKVVFDTDLINIEINGTAIDISYCGKPMESLSGGEQQRVDLILQFAIRDMLSTYTNYSSNIIVLDEIFDNLDRVSTERILTLVSDTLKDVESIFIISHHADSLNIAYDSELRVVKNKFGISEVY